MSKNEPQLRKIEIKLQGFVHNASNKPDDLYHMIQYHMGWVDEHFQKIVGHTGKRLRPLFLILSCEALSDKWDTALPAAVAVELLHNFTLIHDDIEDRDEMRRGRPTVWSIWGVPQAINTGDALYALSYRALLSLSLQYVKFENVVKTAQVFTDTILRITEGQCLDIGFETQNKVSELAYIDMIAGKTAALFGLSCELGAIIADAGETIQRSMRDFGLALGMAFQMQDDILGLWGDPSNTGKPVGSDLVKGKKTLPIIHCAQKNREFHHLTSQSLSDTDMRKAMQLLDLAESYEYTVNKANQYLDDALQVLDHVLPGERQGQIRGLVASLIQRQM